VYIYIDRERERERESYHKVTQLISTNYYFEIE